MSSPPPRAAVRVGTRGSALARIQTEHVVRLLRMAWPGLEYELRPIVTSGDRTQVSGVPLPEIGGKGLFTAELEHALRAGEIDLAVHSLKDLPTEDPPGIALGAVCEREDVRDCLVARDGLTLAALPDGAVVGTSSLRRAAQLRALRSDFEVRSIRGNVDTRVRKVREGEVDAVVLAAAGIRRLGLEDAVTEYLDEMLPAPGQGALAVQCRAGDAAVLALLAPIDDAAARAATTAERVFLRALGAGCTAPVAGLGELSHGGVRLVGLVASVDGAHVVRVTGEGQPDEIGERLAREALAAGADEILDAIRRQAAPPLAGLRVVVTRPLEHAGPLVVSLERLGAEAQVVPLIAIEPIEDVAAFSRLVESENHDWIVFTSANAVRVVGALLPQARARFAAVGPATAGALRELGVEPAFVPERFAAGEVAGGLEPLEGARVLLPQSEIAEPVLADELRARGAAVDVVRAYGTVSLEATDEERARLREADAILLASGSAARSLASALVPPERTLVVCIGPSTAEAARAAGLRVDVVAEESTGQGMIQALVEHVRERA